MSESAPAAWYVVRTQVKREKLAAEGLRRLEGVEVFLPRLRYQKTTRRGKVWWVEAIFPGYLLAKFDHFHMSRAVTYAQGVSKIVGFGNHVPEVPEDFVEALREEVARHQSENEEIVVDWSVKEGDRLEIADGPFKGMEGEVVQVRSAEKRVGLLLEFLGEMKPIEMSIYDLILERPDIPEGWSSENP